MGQYSWKNAYSNLGIQLFNPDMFKQDEKHHGKEFIGTGQILYMLARTQSMFTYDGLPETIPARNLEMMLQLNGNVFFTQYEGDYYVFTGGLGGKPNVYYEPTIYTVANPALNFSKQFKIDEDGVLIRSDSYMVGLLPMMQKYAALMVENEYTMRIADINARIPFLMSAADDRTDKSAKLFLERIVDGEMGIISDSAFLESLKVNPGATQNTTRLTDLIEYQQYLKAAWFNDLGINSNYNMKRESISPDEAQLNDDALLPFVDDMLRCRKLALEKIGDMYGLDISVKLDSSWEKEQIEQLTGAPMPDADVSMSPDPEDETPPGPSSEEIKSAEPEEIIKDSEEKPQELETNSQETETISDDIEEIKEDIEEIKTEIQDLNEENENDGDKETE